MLLVKWLFVWKTRSRDMKMGKELCKKKTKEIASFTLSFVNHS